MRFQHEIGFRIFFSIEGETIGGDPIPNNRGKDQTGEMRMLVLTVPCFLASCCCIAERVKLPECECLRNSKKLFPRLKPRRRFRKENKRLRTAFGTDVRMLLRNNRLCHSAVPSGILESFAEG